MNSETKEKLSKIDVKSWIIIILIILVILLTFGTALFCHKYHNAQKQIVIWNDSAYVYKNKYDEEYAAKNTYILKADQLQKYNDELYKEYKSLKDNPIVITKIVTVAEVDSVGTNTSNVTNNDSLLAWDWDAADKDYYKISGKATANLKEPEKSLVMIDSMQMNSKITLDVIDDGLLLAVIAKSDNPYMNLSGMQSAVIDPAASPTLKNYYKPKRWGFSVYLGAGVNVGYDPINKGIGLNIGPSAGFAVTYDIVQW